MHFSRSLSLDRFSCEIFAILPTTLADHAQLLTRLAPLSALRASSIKGPGDLNTFIGAHLFPRGVDNARVLCSSCRLVGTSTALSQRLHITRPATRPLCATDFSPSSLTRFPCYILLRPLAPSGLSYQLSLRQSWLSDRPNLCGIIATIRRHTGVLAIYSAGVAVSIACLSITTLYSSAVLLSRCVHTLAYQLATLGRRGFAIFLELFGLCGATIISIAWRRRSAAA